MATSATTTSRLIAVTDDVWRAPSEVRQPGGVRMPVNTTIVRLPAGLVVISPIAIDDALAAEIDALGPVRELVAPSCLHHLGMGAAAARWPAARVLVAPGLAAKRRDLRVDGELPG